MRDNDCETEVDEGLLYWVITSYPSCTFVFNSLLRPSSALCRNILNLSVPEGALGLLEATLGHQDWRLKTAVGFYTPNSWCCPAAALRDWLNFFWLQDWDWPLLCRYLFIYNFIALWNSSSILVSSLHLHIAAFLFTRVRPAITLFTQLEHPALSRVNMQHNLGRTYLLFTRVKCHAVWIRVLIFFRWLFFLYKRHAQRWIRVVIWLNYLILVVD